MKKMYVAVVLFFCAAIAFSQGVTTSAIGGQVTDTEGEPLPGATVIAVHGPSGTKYGVSTDFDGYYRISNMRTGGPYAITISYVGFNDFTNSSVYLQLGQTERFSVALSESATALDEVVVTATSGDLFNSNKTGAETVVGQSKIQALPSISRNIADFARLTPQAQIRGDDVISISGQNNRFNAIYIDGAVNNDVFGLAANGTNGGQTGVSPISLDAIESFQISIAPFDVRISGFAGGAISATTRSGTNEFQGSAYALVRNEDLSGKTPVGLLGDGDEREKLPEFSADTYGVRIGGPIIKDKLFFFVNYERQEIETPQPFNVSNYLGNASAADLDALRSFITNQFNYDPGSFNNNINSLESDKLIAKIDWNINDNNNLALRHSYVKATNLSRGSSTPRAINFLNGAQQFPSTTNSTSLELSSRFGDKFANNLVLGYTRVRDDRGFTGNPFPSVSIVDGAGTIFFGSDQASTANLLTQDIVTLTNNFEMYFGKHTITIGTHNEFSSVKNVFFNRNFGEYRFSNLQDFLDGNNANRYRTNYSLLGGIGDDSQGAAEFDLFQLGFYVQDEINISENFKLSAGVRFDIPYWESGLANDDFNTRSVALLEAAGKNLQGARVGKRVDPIVHVSPRVGFNWDVTGNKQTTLRGGFGIFTSRLPLVWPGGMYNNNGLTNGSLTINGAANTPTFTADVNNQFRDPLPGSGGVGGNIDLFAPNFKLPQVFKTNIAIDQKLPGGIIATAEFIHNDNITSIKYENINLAGPQFRTTGADVRPNYGGVRVDNTYDGIYLASNTGEGDSWNAAFTLTKNFYSDFFNATVQGSYSYGESNVFFDGTSSINASQWINIESVNGSNALRGTSRSDFDQGHRITSNSSFSFKWNKNVKTTLGFFYEGADGTPISYVYNDQGNLLRDTFGPNALIYVPANRNEIVLVDANNGLTADQQWEQLNAFISGNEYLNSRRGTHAERNGDRLKWSHVIDFKFAQEFGIMVNNKRHALEFTADIFNFTNLLNKDWGKRYFSNFDAVQLIDFAGFDTDGTTPTFRFNPNAASRLNQIDDSGLQSSRWQMQIGLRYSFN
ncbi:TonB-dependent receptor [Arenibacter sp. GZD96]|uniref:TonB-dependent receptor n=1 Tax=Aurantibrevibacter litoralis TaxID=3106030 RepID=UPI002AFE3FD4|nr:TonB-dependent receptor [Arenibacter sp. GZD-96]MEA1787245.1 TonB-dependent receptor [Arenibacter sp. GZD-96]